MRTNAATKLDDYDLGPESQKSPEGKEALGNAWNRGELEIGRDRTKKRAHLTLIQGLKEEKGLGETIDQYKKQHDHFARIQWGFWQEQEKAQELQRTFEKIYQQLIPHFNIPKGSVIGIDSPQINAYAFKNHPDVYVHTGLFNALLEWCQRNRQELTEDKIAFILAHEMSHIEQGTEEKDGKEALKSDRQKIKNHEYDADRTGILRMAKAGFNPKEGIEVIRFLQSLGEGLPFFSTHPRSADRMRELEDLVNSPDRFLANAERSPTPIGEKEARSLSKETVTHPGTSLYRQQGFSEIQEQIKSTSKIEDTLEVAAMAGYYNLGVIAHFEAKKTYWKNLAAKRIAIHNFGAIIDSLATDINCHSEVGVNYVIGPNGSSRYVQREFNFESFGEPSIDSHDTVETIEKEIEDSTQALLKTIKKFIDIYEKKTSPKDMQILAKLKEFAANDWEIIKSSLARVNDTTLETFIKNTSITVKNGHPHQSEVSNRLKTQSTQELAEWAISSGTPYFTEKSSSEWEEILKARSSGVAHYEDQSDKYLPPQLTAPEDLDTIEGRQKHMNGVLFQNTSFYWMKYAEATDEENLDKFAVSGELLRPIAPRNVPTGYTDKIKEDLNQKFVEHYANLGIQNAKQITDFITSIIFGFYNGYDQEALQAVIDDLTQKDCETIAATFDPSIGEINSSANECFLSETGRDFMYIGDKVGEFLRIGEKQIRRMVLKRLRDQNPEKNPQEELENILKRAELCPDEQLELFFGEIVQCLGSIEFSNANQLHSLIGTYTDRIEGGYKRHLMLRFLQKQLESKMPPSEWMRYLKGETPNVQNQYITKTWFEGEKENLSPQEQLDFLEAVFEVATPRKRSLGRIRSKQEQATELSRDYIEIYMLLHPDSSILIPLEVVLKKWESGKIEKGGRKIFFGSEFIENKINTLTDEEIFEFAELIGREGEEMEKHGNAIDRLSQFISCAAVSLFNNSRPKKIIDLELEDIEFDTSIDIKDNLDAIIRYSKAKSSNRNRLIVQCLEAYGHIIHIFDTDVITKGPSVRAQLVETQSENPDAIHPGGVVNLLSKVPHNKQKKYSHEILPNLSMLEMEASNYDPKSTRKFGDVVGVVKRPNVKSSLIEAYMWDKDLIRGRNAAKHKEQSEVREAVGENIEEIIESMPPTDRAKRVVELIPEETDYKDLIFGEIEEDVFEEYGLELKKGRVTIVNSQAHVPEESLRKLNDFYAYVIPLIYDQATQQFWGRKAHKFYCDYIRKPHSTFNKELTQITHFFPEASYTRDEALEELGNTELLKTPEEAKKLSALLFDNQRRSHTKKEKSQQKQMEIFNEVTALMNRKEKKDFVLWLIGATDQPPLTLRALGGNNHCSVDDIKDYIFGDTAQQREEFLMRILYGTNGIMDPHSEDDNKIFEELLNETFDTVFPSDQGFTEKGREILRTIFVSVLQKYNSFRRSKIFIAMIEALKDAEGESPIGKRMCVLLEQLGPVFIKAGQVLSEEKDESGQPLLPEDISDEIKNLKKNAKPFHRIGAFEVIESMGCFEGTGEGKISSLEQQLGSASIKVVYTAKDKKGDTKVIKLRRPSIGKHLGEDLNVLKQVVEDLEKVEGITLPKGIDRTVEKWMREEADFSTEVKNHKKVAATVDEYQRTRSKSLMGDMTLRTPVIGDASAEHIIEEYGQGITLEDLLKVNRGKVKLEDVVKENFPEAKDTDTLINKYKEYLSKISQIRHLAFDSLIYQILVAGVFHADMHAGNIIITPNNELLLIDLGSAGEIEQEKIENLKLFFQGFLIATQPTLKLMIGSKAQESGNLIRTNLEKFIQYDTSDPQQSREVQKKLQEIEEICNIPGKGTKEIIQKILQTLTDSSFQIHPGFEKFLKALGTGNYLMEGQEINAIQSIIAHSPFKL